MGQNLVFGDINFFRVKNRTGKFRFDINLTVVLKITIYFLYRIATSLTRFGK